MCLLYPHLLPLGTTPWSHWTLETWNILSLTCFDGSFCCKILMIFNICNPRLQSQHHGNSHLVGTISLGEYILEMLLYLKGNVFNCKRKFLVTPSNNDYSLPSRNCAKCKGCDLTLVLPEGWWHNEQVSRMELHPVGETFSFTVFYPWPLPFPSWPQDVMNLVTETLNNILDNMNKNIMNVEWLCNIIQV